MAQATDLYHLYLDELLRNGHGSGFIEELSAVYPLDSTVPHHRLYWRQARGV